MIQQLHRLESSSDINGKPVMVKNNTDLDTESSKVENQTSFPAIKGSKHGFKLNQADKAFAKKVTYVCV